MNTQENKTILKIAWRNVWRNKLRSFVVITAIALGLWAGLFLMAFVLGLNEQRIDSAVNSYLSHLQIHHPKYLETPKIKYTLQEKATALELLKKDKRVKATATRAVIPGMVQNSKGSYGAQILGINPDDEKNITNIHQSLVEGTYFEEDKKNPVLVGHKLAEKLHLKLKSKIIITFQDTANNIIQKSLKVRGIFKTSNSLFDESTIFVRNSDLLGEMGLTELSHEIMATCHSIEDVDAVKADLEKQVTKDKIESWMEVSPDLGYAQSMMSQMFYIFMFIILLALSFSIINTMLMAVLERKKEIGMLMAIGMNKRNLFAMIAYETIFISMVAAPIGILTAFLFITYFGSSGIDFSFISDGLESFGVGVIIHPFLPNSLYLEITIMTLVVAFLSSLIPARRALKLNPTEAIRSL